MPNGIRDTTVERERESRERERERASRERERERERLRELLIRKSSNAFPRKYSPETRLME